MSPSAAPQRLSARLRAIAGLVPAGEPVADIGTDHGRLPIALVANGRSPRAIGVDKRSSPLSLAAANRALVPEAAGVELRLGDGLSVLRAGEVSVVVMAGLGRRTMEQLLGAADLNGLGVRWLVLQPERDPWRLRAWLAGAGWRIEDEALVLDGGRMYTAMRATCDPDSDWWSTWSTADRLLGRPNRRRGGPVLDALIAHHHGWLGTEIQALRVHSSDRALLAERERWLSALDGRD